MKLLLDEDSEARVLVQRYGSAAPGKTLRTGRMPRPALVRVAGDWLYVYLLIEFQSQIDPWMAVRIMVYTGLLYQDLIKSGAVAAGQHLPPVFPLALYNGSGQWTAARGP